MIPSPRMGMSRTLSFSGWWSPDSLILSVKCGVKRQPYRLLTLPIWYLECVKWMPALRNRWEMLLALVLEGHRPGRGSVQFHIHLLVFQEQKAVGDCFDQSAHVEESQHNRFQARLFCSSCLRLSFLLCNCVWGFVAYNRGYVAYNWSALIWASLLTIGASLLTVGSCV